MQHRSTPEDSRLGLETIPSRPTAHTGVRARPMLPPRISRRTAFIAGLGSLAAGLLAGLGLGRLDTAERDEDGDELVPLGASGGRWFRVAAAADVPPGAVLPFTAGALRGCLINHDGTVRALSRTCTHMGCLLHFDATHVSLTCPCHGARFNLRGAVVHGPDGYNATLPPLAAIHVRVSNEQIEVWGV
jgi:nitrite reductase/ring-hydroxylating ferredoxin subunit